LDNKPNAKWQMNETQKINDRDEPNTGIREEATSSLPTRFGDMQLKVYRNQQGVESMAIISGEPDTDRPVPVRVHSACLTGEVLSSMKCDCKSQLDYALQYIADKNGVVIYLSQEGRGVGLVNKIRAYALQEQGLDTVDANRALGLPDDARSYSDAALILDNLGIKQISLLTNNPRKVTDLTSLGIDVKERIPLPMMANQHSIDYLKTKQARMGHLFDMTDKPEEPPPPQEPLSRPIVHVNFALDPDGKTAKDSGQPLELSCAQDWRRVHELREHYSAVVVGARTWQIDNPCLTARSQQLGRNPRRQPDRVIFAGQHDCEFEVDERRTFVVGNGHITPGAIQIESTDHELAGPLKALQWHGVSSILVEGGLTLLGSFIREEKIDQLTIYVRTDLRQTAVDAIQSALPGFPLDSLQFERFGKGILASSGRLAAGQAL
jgi:GTP cyclohydrolase II